MATEKQIAANRRNAMRSTGPRTDPGKTNARVNALKHGMRAETIQVLPGEDPEALRTLLIEMVDEYRPETPTQEHLVRRAAKLMWKERRAENYELKLEGKLFGMIEQAGSGIEKSAIDLFQMLTNQRRYSGALQRDLDRTFDAIRKNRLEHERLAVDLDAPNEPNFDVTHVPEIASDTTGPIEDSAKAEASGQGEPEIVTSEAISESADTEAPVRAESEEPAPQNAPNEAKSEAAPVGNRRSRRGRLPAPRRNRHRRCS